MEVSLALGTVSVLFPPLDDARTTEKSLAVRTNHDIICYIETDVALKFLGKLLVFCLCSTEPLEPLLELGLLQIFLDLRLNSCN